MLMRPKCFSLFICEKSFQSVKPSHHLKVVVLGDYKVFDAHTKTVKILFCEGSTLSNLFYSSHEGVGTRISLKEQEHKPLAFCLDS